MTRKRLEDACAKKDRARAAIDRIEARLNDLEKETRETERRMMTAEREARIATIEGRERDLEGIMSARSGLERLKVERKTHEEALEEARRMYDTATSAAMNAASALRHVEGDLALIELRDLFRENADIVQRIVASPGVSEDRIMRVFNEVAREEADNAQASA